MIEFRNLEASEIEVRAARVTANGVALLLYKDARCDMRILDETVGAGNWQKRFYECKETLFCSVGVKVRRGGIAADGSNIPGEWVWKDDAGAPSNMEAAKGEASDAFKRACFNWGIGRELYTAPFIWVKKEHASIKQDGKRFVCGDRFRVSKIAIDGGIIVGVRIVNDTNGGEVAFSWARHPNS